MISLIYIMYLYDLLLSLFYSIKLSSPMSNFSVFDLQTGSEGRVVVIRRGV